MKHQQNTTKLLRYKHFTKDERNELAILLKKGYSLRDIARVLGRSPASVSRELKRNSVKGQYEPDKAQHKARVKRLYSKYQGMKVRENRWLEKYIQEKLTLHWSPEQITGRLNLETGLNLSFKTIYKYLYSSYGQYYCRYLKYKRYRRKKRKNVGSMREIIKNRVFIDQRPEIINERLRFGDFEADTMGVPKYTRETLATIIERKSRFILARKISRLKYAMNAFKKLLDPFPVLSVTFDNGVENARHQELNVPTYFCHSYHSWEKGSVENALGLIREFIPKKATLKDYTSEDISAIVDTINNIPRKCLNFQTPKEVFEEHFLPKPLSVNFQSVALEGLMHALSP